MKKCNSKRGYVFVEVMLVVVIITILASVSIHIIGTSFRDYNRRAEIYARQNAKAESETYEQMKEQLKNKTYDEPSEAEE